MPNTDTHRYSADRNRDPFTVSNASGVLIPHAPDYGDDRSHEHPRPFHHRHRHTEHAGFSTGRAHRHYHAFRPDGTAYDHHPIYHTGADGHTDPNA